MNDSMGKVDLEIGKAKDRGLKLGVKLVRGAYLKKEMECRNISQSSAETSINYDRNAEQLIKHGGYLVLAT